MLTREALAEAIKQFVQLYNAAKFEEACEIYHPFVVYTNEDVHLQGKHNVLAYIKKEFDEADSPTVVSETIRVRITNDGRAAMVDEEFQLIYPTLHRPPDYGAASLFFKETGGVPKIVSDTSLMYAPDGKG